MTSDRFSRMGELLGIATTGPDLALESRKTIFFWLRISSIERGTAYPTGEPVNFLK
jgi:hypothetical protein